MEWLNYAYTDYKRRGFYSLPLAKQKKMWYNANKKNVTSCNALYHIAFHAGNEENRSRHKPAADGIYDQNRGE